MSRTNTICATLVSMFSLTMSDPSRAVDLPVNMTKVIAADVISKSVERHAAVRHMGAIWSIETPRQPEW